MELFSKELESIKGSDITLPSTLFEDSGIFKPVLGENSLVSNSSILNNPYSDASVLTTKHSWIHKANKPGLRINPENSTESTGDRKVTHEVKASFKQSSKTPIHFKIFESSTLENNTIHIEAKNSSNHKEQRTKSKEVHINQTKSLTTHESKEQSKVSTDSYLKRLLREHAPHRVNSTEENKAPVLITIGDTNKPLAEHFKLHKGCSPTNKQYKKTIVDKPARTKEEILRQRKEMMKSKIKRKATEVLVNVSHMKNPLVKLPPQELLNRLANGLKPRVRILLK